MEPSPSSIVASEWSAAQPFDLRALFDVPVWAAAGEVHNESVGELSPLTPLEIPGGYHRWVEKRQREFRGGRHFAKCALVEAGLEAPSVRRGDDGLPIFPAGFHGAITHTGRELTYAAAAICSTSAHIGLDAENHKLLSADMIDAVMRPSEQRRFHESSSLPHSAPRQLGHFGLWIFSMKEAYYKCVYPRCAAPFGFLDVEVTVNMEEQSFLARLQTGRYPDVPKQLTGRYQLDEKRIVCGVTWALQAR